MRRPSRGAFAPPRGRPPLHLLGKSSSSLDFSLPRPPLPPRVAPRRAGGGRRARRVPRAAARRRGARRVARAPLGLPGEHPEAPSRRDAPPPRDARGARGVPRRGPDRGQARGRAGRRVRLADREGARLGEPRPAGDARDGRRPREGEGPRPRRGAGPADRPRRRGDRHARVLALAPLSARARADRRDDEDHGHRPVGHGPQGGRGLDAPRGRPPSVRARARRLHGVRGAPQGRRASRRRRGRRRGRARTDGRRRDVGGAEPRARARPAPRALRPLRGGLPHRDRRGPQSRGHFRRPRRDPLVGRGRPLRTRRLAARRRARLPRRRRGRRRGRYRRRDRPRRPRRRPPRPGGPRSRFRPSSTG